MCYEICYIVPCEDSGFTVAMANAQTIVAVNKININLKSEYMLNV